MSSSIYEAEQYNIRKKDAEYESRIKEIESRNAAQLAQLTAQLAAQLAAERLKSENNAQLVATIRLKDKQILKLEAEQVRKDWLAENNRLALRSAGG